MINWYILRPSSIFIFFPISALWNSLKRNVIQQIRKIVIFQYVVGPTPGAFRTLSNLCTVFDRNTDKVKFDTKFLEYNVLEMINHRWSNTLQEKASATVIILYLRI